MSAVASTLASPRPDQSGFLNSAGSTLLFLVLIFSTTPAVHAATDTQKTGCLSGDCKNGEGMYRWESGALYEDSWANGQQHGHGEERYPGGVTVKCFKAPLNPDPW